MKPRDSIAPPAPPPERCLTTPESGQGVFRKFEVRRVDGKHPDREYFVLDVAHDPHARPALAAYAGACAWTHPQLAADMCERYGLVDRHIGSVAETVLQLRVQDIRMALASRLEAAAYELRQGQTPMVNIDDLFHAAGLVREGPYRLPPTDQDVDRHLDAVLRASGSALKHYSLPNALAKMRAAIRAAMTGAQAGDQC